MTSEVPNPDWRARYPDLAGKVAVVSGAGQAVAAIVATLAANGISVAVVSPNRETVDAAVAAAESHSVPVLGVTADPNDTDTWGRVTPHAEQRLGPIDIVVAVGIDADRRAAVLATAPDMGARRRGVIVEVGESGDLPAVPQDVRHRVVKTVGEVPPVDVAAAVALCVSDVIAIPIAAIELGGG